MKDFAQKQVFLLLELNRWQQVKSDGQLPVSKFEFSFECRFRICPSYNSSRGNGGFLKRCLTIAKKLEILLFFGPGGHNFDLNEKFTKKWFRNHFDDLFERLFPFSLRLLRAEIEGGVRTPHPPPPPSKWWKIWNAVGAWVMIWHGGEVSKWPYWQHSRFLAEKNDLCMSMNLSNIFWMKS